MQLTAKNTFSVVRKLQGWKLVKPRWIEISSSFIDFQGLLKNG